MSDDAVAKETWDTIHETGYRNGFDRGFLEGRQAERDALLGHNAAGWHDPYDAGFAWVTWHRGYAFGVTVSCCGYLCGVRRGPLFRWFPRRMIIGDVKRLQFLWAFIQWRSA